MRNAILRQLLAEYEQTRADDRREEERRRQEATARCPEIARVLEARQQLIFRGVRGILAGQGSAEALPGQMDVLTRQLRRLLEQSGLPADYLEPVYRCPRCRDTGYTGEPVKEMCDCLRSRYFAQLYRRVGLSERGEQSFERFDETVFPDTPLPGDTVTQRQYMRVFRDVCQRYADRYPQADTPDMLLMGQSGLGKTFLLHAMAKRLLDRGLNVLLISAFRFLELARRAYLAGQSEEMDALLTTDVLMIDDLGTEPLMENITVAQLFHLLTERQSAGRGTVFSTNLTLRELRERYTERVASRLSDPRQCTQLTFLGEDVRRRQP